MNKFQKLLFSIKKNNLSSQDNFRDNNIRRNCYLEIKNQAQKRILLMCLEVQKIKILILIFTCKINRLSRVNSQSFSSHFITLVQRIIVFLNKSLWCNIPISLLQLSHVWNEYRIGRKYCKSFIFTPKMLISFSFSNFHFEMFTQNFRCPLNSFLVSFSL